MTLKKLLEDSVQSSCTTSYSSRLFLAFTKQITSRLFLFCIMSRDFLLSGKVILLVTFAQPVSLNPDVYSKHCVT